jgi:hypothetical protein
LNFIHWYDWITPTTPVAAIFFGIILSLIVAFGVVWETRNWRFFYLAFVSGTTVTLFGVAALVFSGFYS